MDGRCDPQVPVKCFTCPRERRGRERGWYFVDLRHRGRASAAARIFVCPRHYSHFAERERGRWSALIDPEMPVSPTWPAAGGARAEPTVLAYGGKGDAIASE